MLVCLLTSSRQTGRGTVEGGITGADIATAKVQLDKHRQESTKSYRQQLPQQEINEVKQDHLREGGREGEEERGREWAEREREGGEAIRDECQLCKLLTKKLHAGPMHFLTWFV